MTSTGSTILGLACALALGALAPTTARADGPATPATATPPAKPAATAPAASAPAASTATATTAPSAATADVTDQYGEPMRVEDPSFFKPSSGFSLGGGGKGNKLKEIHVWKGAHEILVPLEKITRIEVGKPCDADLVEVRIFLVGDQKLDGKMDRDLELRGKVQFGQYQIKVERLKLVVFRA